MKLAVLGALGAGLYLAMQSPDVGQRSDVPRGIRNNNPGNIEKGAPWQGLAADQSGDDRFAVFASPVFGIRALARVLGTYRERHGLSTIRGIISRWAPANENNTEAYIQAVANETRLPDALVLREADYLPVIKAIIRHENGVQPYPDSIIREGIERARA